MPQPHSKWLKIREPTTYFLKVIIRGIYCNEILISTNLLKSRPMVVSPQIFCFVFFFFLLRFIFLWAWSVKAVAKRKKKKIVTSSLGRDKPPGVRVFSIPLRLILLLANSRQNRESVDRLVLIPNQFPILNDVLTIDCASQIKKLRKRIGKVKPTPL